MHRTSITVVVLAAALALGGCQMFNKEKAKEERTSMTAIPDAVRTAFNKEYPNANVTSVVRETEKDGAIHYEIKFTDQSGRKQEAEYDGMGMRAHEEK